MKKLIMIIGVALLLSSCADEKTLTLNGRNKTFEPYGWADYEELKNDSIYYKVNIGNIVCDVILIETVAIPIWLTGWQLYEPIKVKEEFIKPMKNINDTIPKFTIIK